MAWGAGVFAIVEKIAAYVKQIKIFFASPETTTHQHKERSRVGGSEEGRIEGTQDKVETIARMERVRRDDVRRY